MTQHIIKIQNPKGKTLFYRDSDHKYFDENDRVYHSTTEIIHSLFPAFDDGKWAYIIGRKRYAKENGYDEPKDVPTSIAMKQKEIVLEEWEDKKNVACDLGNQVHRYAECKLKDIPFDMHLTSEKAKRYTQHLDTFIPQLLQHYEFVEAEKIVFGTNTNLAGTIDLLMKNRTTGQYCIFDWKTNKSIDKRNGYDEYGKIFLEHIPHAKYWLYSLQLSVYQWILQNENYGNFENVETGLFHITPTGVTPMKTPLLSKEAEQIIEYVNQLKGD